MHSSEIELFPVNYNKFNESEFCLRCGLTFRDFVKFGKIGCGNCSLTFREAIYPYKKLEFRFQKKRFQSLEGFSQEFFLKIENRLPVSERVILQKTKEDFISEGFSQIEEIEKRLFENFNRSEIQFRYRVARNYKGLAYPGINDELDEDLIYRIKNNFFQNVKIPRIQKNAPIPYEKNSFLLLFDEDHFRFEIFSINKEFYRSLLESCDKMKFLNSKELFDFHPRVGFLTACPTNMGRGNKLSVYANLQNFSKSDSFLLKEIIGNSLDYKFDINTSELENNPSIRLYLYKKNIHFSKIRNFYEYLYFILLYDQNRKNLK